MDTYNHIVDILHNNKKFMCKISYKLYEVKYIDYYHEKVTLVEYHSYNETQETISFKNFLGLYVVPLSE